MDMIPLHSCMTSSRHFQEQVKVCAAKSAALKNISTSQEQVLVNVHNWILDLNVSAKVATNTWVHVYTSSVKNSSNAVK